MLGALHRRPRADDEAVPAGITVCGLHYLSRILGGLGLLGIGVGGGALLLMMIDYVVRLLGRFARLHYTLLNKADAATSLGVPHVQNARKDRHLAD